MKKILSGSNLVPITLKNIELILKKGHDLCEKKEWEDAYVLAKACLAQFPHTAEIYWLLGRVCFGKKDYGEAERYFNIGISLNPRHFEGYYLIGQLLAIEQRLPEAQNAYLKCIKLNPQHAHAIYNLAYTYQQQGRKQEAISAYQQALEQDQGLLQAHTQLGILYHQLNELTQAIKHYNKALQQQANNEDKSNLLSNLGAALTKDKQFSQAIYYYEQTLAINPNHLEALSNLSGTYIEIKQYEEAIYYLRKSLTIDPYLTENWRNLVLCRKYESISDPDCVQILMLINSDVLSQEQKIPLYFALGKIFDDCEQHQEAFTYFQIGNSLKSKHAFFEMQSFANHVQNISHVFSNASIPSFYFEESNIVPIIIVGSPRSGKSLLEALLTEHKKIVAGSEIGIGEFRLEIPLENRPKGSYPFWINTLTFEEASSIREAYLNKMGSQIHKNAQYCIDTLPGNFLYLGLIILLFPHAKIIHCTREPMDACLSMYFKYFLEGHDYSYDLTKLGQYYQIYQKMMHFWLQYMPKSIFEISYEDMVLHHKDKLTSLLHFLGLNENSHLKSVTLNTREIGRWKSYEKYLQPLIQSLKQPLPDALLIPSDDLKGENAQIADLMAMASYQFDQKDFEGVLIQLNKLFEKDANHASAHYLMGKMLNCQQKYHEAIAHLEKAVLQLPTLYPLQIDLAIAYQNVSKKMQAEYHLQNAQALRFSKEVNANKIMQSSEREVLLSAFNRSITIEDEYEKKLLISAKIRPDLTTESYMTRSWDQYFTDLSYGSFKEVEVAGRHSWRVRAWHFLFKNVSLIETILQKNQSSIRILDVGCATGYLRRFLEGNVNPAENKHFYYWGIDIRHEALQKALKAVDDIESGACGNLVPSAFVRHDLNFGLPFCDNFFDFIINFEMIKYLPVELGKLLLSEMYRVLNAQGRLFLSTTYSASHPGFMESVPFSLMETLLAQNGFEIVVKQGSQATFTHLQSYLRPEHITLINALQEIYPPEIIAAFITPLYPQCAQQITFECKIK